MNNKAYKVVLLGQTTVGKTSITGRLVNGKFLELIDSTIGASFFQLKHNGIRFDIWDAAGQERYSCLSEIYYRNANIAILVFDLNNLETIKIVDYYINQIMYMVEQGTCKIILIGNKMDLLDEGELEKIKNKIRFHFLGLKDYIILYLSAKNNIGFNELTKTLIEISKDLEGKKNDDNLINIEKNKNNKISKCSCY